MKKPKTARIITAAVLLLPFLLCGCAEQDPELLTGSTTNIYELSGSGMDIDQMVKAAMLTRQNEYDRLYKKEVRQEWLKEAYADLYSEIDRFASVSLSKYKMSSTFAPMQVTSSNSNVVTAFANADAIETSHAVRVERVATNASLITKDGIVRTGEETGKSICLENLLTDIDDDGVSFEITDNAGGDETSAKIVAFTKDEIVSEKLTLVDLASAINKTGLHLAADYDAANDVFSLDNTETGKRSFIGIDAYDKNGNYNRCGAELINNLNLCEVVSGADGLKEYSDIKHCTPDDRIEACGENAAAVIDGRTYTDPSNEMTVSNVTYFLVGIGGEEIPINVTVKMDTERSIQNVRAFVEDYNKMIDKLNELYKEEKYDDYDVLTKEEEEMMSEEEIEKWNRKAKAGLLKGNQTLAKMISKMREAMYTPVSSVDGEYDTMMSIGITSSDTSGHLQLDEDKLTKALQEDSGCVWQLFCSVGDDSLTGAKKYYSTGAACRLYDSTMAVLEEMKSYAGTTAGIDDSYLGTLILNLKNKRTNFEENMQVYRDKMYKKYDAMETALDNLNSQFESLGLTSGDEE